MIVISMCNHDGSCYLQSLLGARKILIMPGHHAAENTFDEPREDAGVPCMQFHTSHTAKSQGNLEDVWAKNFP